MYMLKNDPMFDVVKFQQEKFMEVLAASKIAEFGNPLFNQWKEADVMVPDAELMEWELEDNGEVLPEVASEFFNRDHRNK